jgi:hypothetical protein
MTARHTSSVDEMLPGISAEELLRRAVRSARARHTRSKHPRWVGVMDAFALGSNYSRGLCLRFGLDPDEMVRR